jgi:hypothetical protein
MINSFKSWLWESWFAAFRPSRTKSPTDNIYQNPTLTELQKIQEGDQVRAIFAGDRVYAWNPTTALHDQVMRKLNLGGSATYAVIFPRARLVQVVAGSQLQVSHLQSHPYVTRMRFEVEAVSNYGA